MATTNGNGGTVQQITYKQKLHEPILNPIQVLLLLLIVVFEVVINVLPVLMGMDINPWWVMGTLIVGIVSFAVLSLLRAAYPEAMPDTRITTAFQVFIKQIVDALFSSKDEKSDLKAMLERLMVWAVREWDVIYQLELAEAIEYAKAKFLERELIDLEEYSANTDTTTDGETAEFYEDLEIK